MTCGVCKMPMKTGAMTEYDAANPAASGYCGCLYPTPARKPGLAGADILERLDEVDERLRRLELTLGQIAHALSKRFNGSPNERA